MSGPVIWVYSTEVTRVKRGTVTALMISRKVHAECEKTFNNIRFGLNFLLFAEFLVKGSSLFYNDLVQLASILWKAPPDNH